MRQMPSDSPCEDRTPLDDCRKISITLIFRFLTDGPDASRTESSRNLSAMACLQQLGSCGTLHGGSPTGIDESLGSPRSGLTTQE
jgi:hypothetical protein